MRSILASVLCVALATVTACGDDDPPIYEAESNQGNQEVLAELQKQLARDRDQRFRASTLSTLRRDLAYWMAHLRAQAEADYTQRSFFEGNRHGIEIEVPIGRYAGIGIVNAGVDETIRYGSVITSAAEPLAAPPNRSSGVRGWAFEPVSVLTRRYNLMDASTSQQPISDLQTDYITRCTADVRYELVGQHSALTFRGPGTCSFLVADRKAPGYPDINQGPSACLAVMQTLCRTSGGPLPGTSAPAEYIGDDGESRLVISGDAATLYDGAGTQTRYGLGIDPNNAFDPQTQERSYHVVVVDGLLVSHSTRQAVDRAWLPLDTTDRNGNVKRMTYEGARPMLTKITDEQGRETRYLRGPFGGLEAIELPGPGGNVLRYGIRYTGRTWTPPATVNRTEAYTTVAGIDLPDGRSYEFQYTESGHLTEVKFPDGSLRRYHYAPDPEVSATQVKLVENVFNDEEEVFPLGEKGGSYKILHPTPYSTIEPDGSTHNVQYAPRDLSCQPRYGGKLAEETRAADGTVLQRDAFQYSAKIVADGVGNCRVYVDENISAIAHEKDGLAWSESMTYYPNPRFAGRTTRAVAHHEQTDPAGPTSTIDRVFEASPALVERNILKLVREESIAGHDGAGGAKILSLTTFEYDGLPVLPSGRAGIVDVGSARGNITRATRYANPAARAGAVSVQTQYQDDGLVAKEWTARAVEAGAPDRLARRHAYDPTACTPGHPRWTASIVMPEPGNGTVHAIETTSDCATNLVLRQRDPNGATTCRQYDALGRLLEVAGPGDQLSPIENAVRDPACSTGDGGATEWFEYPEQHAVGRGRTIVHRKNGRLAGQITATWLDGQGRVVQTCSEVDRAGLDPHVRQSMSTLPVSCTWRSYDHAGRQTEGTVSVFQSKMPEAVYPIPATALREQRSYDALGRLTTVISAGGRTTQHAYSAAEGRALVTTVLPKGPAFVVRRWSDVLGHLIATERKHDGCDGGWCRTSYGVDGLGQMRSITEPTGNGFGGHRTEIVHDGLGHVITMTDPDRGTITSAYDANGNKIRETDASGRTVTFAYDMLDRLVERTVPDAGSPAEQVETTQWDNTDPTVPAGLASELSAPAQIGHATSRGNGAFRTWTRYDEVGNEIAVFTRADGTLYAARNTYGYPAGPFPGLGNVLLSAEIPHACLGTSSADCNTPAEIVSYGYDRAGLVSSIETSRGGGTKIVEQIVRNAGGDVTSVAYGNGAVSSRSYGADRAVRSILTKSDAGIIQSVRYDRDAHDNVTAVLDYVSATAEGGCDPDDDDCRAKDLSARYEYDALDRVSLMTTSGATRSWDYDAVGNLRAMRQTGEAEMERVLEHGGPGQPAHAVTRVREGGREIALTYDRAGNLVKTQGRATDVAIQWNADNMPTRITGASGVLSEKHFVGEHLWKRVEGDKTIYFLGALRIERTAAGSDREFVSYGTHAMTDPDAGGAVRWLHSDLVQSTAVVTDEHGRPVARETFWPFGESRTSWGTYHALKRFDGKEHEDATGFIDFGARLYDPTIGHWISADDDERDGFTRYTFVQNNPVTMFDPDGHQTKKKQVSPRTDGQRRDEQQTQQNQTAQPQNGGGRALPENQIVVVWIPQPGPVRGVIAAALACGGAQGGWVSCRPLQPVQMPGNRTLVGIQLNEHVVNIRTRPMPAEPAAPAPSSGSGVGGSVSHFTFELQLVTSGPQAGQWAVKVGAQAVPGMSMGVRPINGVESGASVSLNTPVGSMDLVKVDRNGKVDTFAAPSPNATLDIENGKVKAPKSWKDFFNLEAALTITGSDLKKIFTPPPARPFNFACAKVGTCN